MLPKTYRIQQSKEIQNLIKSKFRINSQFFQIIISKSSYTNFRLLVVISKKIHKRAVFRNKLKRKVFAIFEELKKKERLPTNFDCAILAKNKDVLVKNSQQIKEDVLLNLSNIYKKATKNGN